MPRKSSVERFLAIVEAFVDHLEGRRTVIVGSSN